MGMYPGMSPAMPVTQDGHMALHSDVASGSAATTATFPNSNEKMMPGDWICPKCSDLVFARNVACRRCATPRPGGAGGDSAGSGPGGDAIRGVGQGLRGSGGG